MNADAETIGHAISNYQLGTVRKKRPRDYILLIQVVIPGTPSPIKLVSDVGEAAAEMTGPGYQILSHFQMGRRKLRKIQRFKEVQPSISNVRTAKIETLIDLLRTPIDRCRHDAVLSEVEIQVGKNAVQLAEKSSAFLLSYDERFAFHDVFSASCAAYLP